VWLKAKSPRRKPLTDNAQRKLRFADFPSIQFRDERSEIRDSAGALKRSTNHVRTVIVPSR
jgi:hypothetical protein